MINQKYSKSALKRKCVVFGDLQEGLLLVALYTNLRFIFEIADYTEHRINIEIGSAKYIAQFSPCGKITYATTINCYFPTYQEYIKYYSMKGI